MFGGLRRERLLCGSMWSPERTQIAQVEQQKTN